MTDTPTSSSPARRPLYRTFALLGVTLACLAGGAIGYFLSQPLYRSDSVVRVAAPPYFGGDYPPNQDAVLSVEAYLIASRTTLGRAAQGPHWDPAWPTPTQLADGGDQHLGAEVLPDWQLRVFFQDTNPQTARECLQAIMLAYHDLKRERAAKRRAMTQPVQPDDDATPNVPTSAGSPSPSPVTRPSNPTPVPPGMGYIVSGPSPAVAIVDPRAANTIRGALIGGAAAIAAGLAFLLLRGAWQAHHPRHPSPAGDEAAGAEANPR